MEQQTTTAPEGNIFESANQVTNPAAEQPIFAMTKGDIGTARPTTAKEISEALASPGLQATVNEVRAETDEQKQKELKEKKKFCIPGLCPHFTQFRNNHRAAADALPECCTYTTCIDVDDRTYGQQAVSGAKRLTEQQGTKWFGKVLYIENSLRAGGKVHIFVRQPLGMTAIETQQEFCRELAIPCDESVQQKQSFILMTGDVVYQSDQWLKPLTEQQREAYREAFRLRGLGIDGWPLVKSAAQPATAADAPISKPAEGDIAEPTDTTDYIFEACMKEAQVRPADLLIENDPGRRNSVKAILSVGLPQLMTQGEFLGQIQHRAPEYFREERNNLQRLVSDFYTKYTDSSARLTQFQRMVLAQSRRISEKHATTAEQATPTSQSFCDELTLSEIYASERPPRMNPKKLPRLLKAVTSRTPKDNIDCVAQACFPSLMAHPVDFSAKYIDNRYRQLRGNCVTVAVTGIGKTCIDLPVAHIMADIEAVTAAERKKEHEYHQKYNTRNSNQDKPKRPKFRIRSLMPDLTPAALVLRTQDNSPAPLYCKMNEIEQWDKVENASGSKNQFTILKLDDDEGNQFGAERAGTQSVTAATSLFLNWNASTTPQKLLKYFRHVMTDGPISRLTMATIPDPGIGAPTPVFGNYDDGYVKSLRPFIDNLNAATGAIQCRQAEQMIHRLKAECDEFSIVSGDRVFDNLTHRALVHVFRKAICIYAANGMKWEKNIETYCRWSLHYDIWLKLFYFGDAIRDAEKDAPTCRRGPQNLLEKVGDKDGVFKFGDVSDARFLQGMSREGTANQIYQWKHRGLILQLTADSYKKVQKKV